MHNSFLINKLFTYQNLSSTKDNYRVRVELNPQHPVYEGHFPDNPITPGVCAIQMIKEIVMDIRKVSLNLKQLSYSKFINFIDPQKHPSFEINIQLKNQSKEEIELMGTIKNKDRFFVKILGTYKVSPSCI